jgi:WD40-like Beta Propeller Repeat
MKQLHRDGMGEARNAYWRASPPGARASRARRLRAGQVLTIAGLTAALASCATTTNGGGAAIGDEEKPDQAARQLRDEVGGKAKGVIVWSSSRTGNHDLFVMNTDGSHIRQITRGDAVDWFPRFSPSGSRILFTRSKNGWVYERDANTDGKWDIYTVTPEGKEETKVVDNASWGSWLSEDEIVYAKSTAIIRRKLEGGDETVLVDSTKVPELDGALLQQPEMSTDGRYIAITLRGSKRETGIWNIHKKTWTRTGEGCQINWTPLKSEVYWVHPTGNGGSRVLHMPIANGKPAKSDSDLDALTLIDIPGRRSHEYFPQLSADGKWLVWAATQRGHEHDTADYEIYLWEVGASPDTAARLTFHSANDRWPDIFISGAVAAGESLPPADSAGAGVDDAGAKVRAGADEKREDDSEEDDAGKTAPAAKQSSKSPANKKKRH